MTDKSNTNYTDAQRVLDFLMNPSNYGACYDCYDGNHGWSGDVELSDAEKSKIINADRTRAKFIWWNNRKMEMNFMPCVENHGDGGDTLCLYDYYLYVEEGEALDFMKIDDVEVHSQQRLQLWLDDEEVSAHFETALGWNDDRLDAAAEAAYALYYTK